MGRWKKFTEKLETMTQDERMASFAFVDPESNMTFLETAKIWEKHDIVKLLIKYGAEDAVFSSGKDKPDEEMK